MKNTMNYEAPVAEMIELQAIAGVMTGSPEPAGNESGSGTGGGLTD
jgi:hypothetical protein